MEANARTALDAHRFFWIPMQHVTWLFVAAAIIVPVGKLVSQFN